MPYLKLTRDQIARIVGDDPRAIKQFENLFAGVDEITNVGLVDIAIQAGNALVAANEALASVRQLADAFGKSPTQIDNAALQAQADGLGMAPSPQSFLAQKIVAGLGLQGGGYITQDATLAVASGTAFPASPANGDIFYRTDRNIDYYYDGTRWLSTVLYTLQLDNQDATLPYAGSTDTRTGNPWWGLYDIFVERFMLASYNSADTATDYFSVQLRSTGGAVSTNLGAAISTQGDTAGQMIGHSDSVAAVVPSTESEFDALATATGSPASYLLPSFRYRLVG